MAEYLNSWSDDWTYPVSSAEQSTEQTPTLETIRQVMREFQEKWKDVDLGPDVWVLTDEELQQLKLLNEKSHPHIESLGMPIYEPAIYGIRIEHLPTQEQVRARVLELADHGVKAGFIGESK